MKVDRVCPRCRSHQYHNSTLRGGQKKEPIVVTCVDCGHEWSDRSTKKERGL